MAEKWLEIAVFTAALTGAAAGLAACKHSSPPPPCDGPESNKLRIEAAPRLNLDERGESLPTTLHIYQLKSDKKLREAAFEDVLDREKETLGDELISSQEITIAPAERSEQPLARAPEAAYVAVVALFRQPAGTFWRAIVKLAPPDPERCRKPLGEPAFRVRLQENRIEVR